MVKRDKVSVEWDEGDMVNIDLIHPNHAPNNWIYIDREEALDLLAQLKEMFEVNNETLAEYEAAPGGDASKVVEAAKLLLDADRALKGWREERLMSALAEYEAAAPPEAVGGYNRTANQPAPPGGPSLGEAERPRIVCLCGSTRFMETFFEEGWRLTLEGVIVRSVGVCKHADSHGGEALGQDVADRLDELHLRKIDLADEVRILNVGGYIGSSTRKELEYARRCGKPVTFLEAATALVRPDGKETT